MFLAGEELMSETPDSCPNEDCDADIVKTETVDVEADPRARDPRTEPVVTCAEGHQQVM